jgi:hypothetical protein
MKKILALVAALAIPALLFLNAWEGYKYGALSREVSVLEKRQRDLLEQNMGVVSRIAYEQSPQRVEQKASEQLDLVKIDPSRVTRVVVGNGGEQAQ